MANTPSFNWETPDDTDLVKDGAAAIRTLGNAIDSSMTDLKGGTTGQVLSKASNTDMDFTWVAQDDSNAIQNALLTTTGDTIYASSASTPARLGIGSTGQVLTVSGGVPSWATPASGGMTLLSTTTLSGASTTISSISGSYNDLQIILYGVNMSTNGYWEGRLNGVTNLFNSQGVIRDGATNAYNPYIDATITHYRANTAGNTSNVWQIRINNYSSTATFKPVNFYGLYQGSGGVPVTESNGGVFRSTSAITSITFAANTGTFSGGTVLLYGVK